MAKRQGIITALKAQLGNISIVNGYNTDIGSNVDEWNLVPYDVKDLPVIEIRDEDMTVEEDMNNVLSNKALNITITVYNSVSSTIATNARLYIADILKAIRTDLQLGGNAYQVDETGASIEASQDSDLIVGAIVNITAYYQTNKWSD